MENAIAWRERNPRFGSTFGIRLVELGAWPEWNLLHRKGRYATPRDTILRICHAQDYSHLDSGEAIRFGTSPICRWQIHFVRSKRLQGIHYQAGKKLSLKTEQNYAVTTTQQSPFLGTRRLWAYGRQPLVRPGKLLKMIVWRGGTRSDHASHRMLPTRQSGEVTNCSGALGKCIHARKSGTETVRLRCICQH